MSKPNITPSPPLSKAHLAALAKADADRPRYSDRGAAYDPATGTYRQRYSSQRYHIPQAPARPQDDT